MQEDSSTREAKNVQRDRDLRTRAMRDEAFRQALLSDPRGTLERELGATIPSGVTIQVHEETLDTVHIVIPGRPAGAGSGSDQHVDDTVGTLRRNEEKSNCCTCGSSTHQTFNI